MSEKSKSMGKDFILFASKASRLIETDKIQHALNLCEAGVRNFPFYAPGHYILGLCYEAMDNKDEAKNEFERAVVYDPSHSKAMRKLSEFYAGSGLKQIADEWLVKEALYNPLDKALITLLKEKNIYALLNPISNEADNLIEDDVQVKKEDFISGIDGFEPEDSLYEEEISDDVEPLDQKENITPVEEGDNEVENLIDNLDPLAGEHLPERNPSDVIKEEERTEINDANKYTNMEDDFSTIMEDFFDKDEEAKQISSENDEWIEVENLLIDEAETPVKNIRVEADENEQNETGPNEDKENMQDETELLLEQLSDFETVGENAEEETDLSVDEENILTPDEILDYNKAEDDKYEPIPSRMPDFEPEPVIENVPLPENSLEEEVTIKDLMENPNLVTPTFGEILISQHKFSEARHIFMELLKREPDNSRLLKKIHFLDKFIAAQKA